MRAFLLALLWVIPAYFAGLFACLWLVPFLSGNAHDGGVEAAMTGAFVGGPLCALVGFGAGVFFHRARWK